MAGVRQAPGGASSICLGLTDSELKAMKSTSSNAFASNANQNSGNVLTERPTTTLLAPPGGRSTICLGESPEVTQTVPPGGKSSICLGMDGKGTAPVSSNAFACGVSQNCGNVLTERPTTLLHAPPGGHSTICLRHDEPAAAETPRRVCAGGASSVCLGTDVSEWSVSSRALGHSRAPIEEETKEQVKAVDAEQETETEETKDLVQEEDVVEIEEDARFGIEEASQAQPSEEVEGTTSTNQNIEKISEIEKIEEKEVSKPVQSDLKAFQDLPTPARRAPPGGVATVLLG